MNEKPKDKVIPYQDWEDAIGMLKQHCFTQEEMDEVGDDLSKVDDTVGHNNALIIKLLGGKLP